MKRHYPSSTLLLIASVTLYVCTAIYVRRNSDSFGIAAALPPRGAAVPTLAGYSAEGELLAPKAGAGCVLLHYTDSSCQFCRAESALWHDVARQVVADGCRVATVLPYARTAAPTPTYGPIDPRPIVFVPYAWAAAVPLDETPTTILLDREGRVAWLRVGTLDADASRSLNRALSAAVRR